MGWLGQTEKNNPVNCFCSFGNENSECRSDTCFAHDASFFRKGRAEFKSCHSDQLSTAIMIRSCIVKAVLIFYSKALIYKAFLCFISKNSVRIKIISVLPTEI